MLVEFPTVPPLYLKEGEKLKSNEDWKVLLSNEALHYQGSLQDAISHRTVKIKLQVFTTDKALHLSKASSILHSTHVEAVVTPKYQPKQ